MVVLALFVAIAYKIRMLTLGGAFSSWGIGVVVCAAFGYRGLGLLLLFFISSSLLSKWGKEKKKKLRTLSVESKGRNAGQVFANGGAAFLAGAGFLFFHILSGLPCLLPVWQKRLLIRGLQKLVFFQKVSRIISCAEPEWNGEYQEPFLHSD